MIKSEKGEILFKGTTDEVLADYTCINHNIIDCFKENYNEKGFPLNETDVASIIIAGDPEFYVEFMKDLALGLEHYMKVKKWEENKKNV